MKLFYRLIILSALVIPITTFAAYNDVTLTTSAVIKVGSYTLNIYGSSAVIQSMVVSSTTLQVTLASGSSATILSPSLNQLSSDVTSDVIGNTCNGSNSVLSLAYVGAGTVTNTITPSATICTNPVGSGATVFSSGGGSTVSPTALATILAPSASTTAYLNSLANTTVPGCPAGWKCVPTSTSTPSFARNLTLGSIGSDVKALQMYLNAHGFTIAVSGTGSPGHESTYFGTLTKAAIAKFQSANGITPAAGYFGPITRKAISQLP